MVTQHFKHQGVVGILKDQTLFEADTDFVIVGAELAQADALMEMRLAHAALRISNRLADLPPFLSGLGADFFEQAGVDADGFHLSVRGSKGPLKETYFSLARRLSMRFLNSSHSTGVTPYSWKR